MGGWVTWMTLAQSIDASSIGSSLSKLRGGKGLGAIRGHRVVWHGKIGRLDRQIQIGWVVFPACLENEWVSQVRDCHTWGNLGGMLECLLLRVGRIRALGDFIRFTFLPTLLISHYEKATRTSSGTWRGMAGALQNT